jgi:hypothetical protein
VISGYVREAVSGESGGGDVVLDVSDVGVDVEMLGYVVEYLVRRRGVDLMVVRMPLCSLDLDEVYSDVELGGFGDCGDMGRFRKFWRGSHVGDYVEIRKFIKEYVGMLGEREWLKWLQLSMVASYFDVKGLLSLCMVVLARYFASLSVVELNKMKS